tara:strand:- start:17 stop:2209 length:2193 start_codon:yes stop_codon:yes gene_type:complete
MLGGINDPALIIDPAISSTLDIIDVTRAGDSTVQDVNGDTVNVSANTIRVDYTNGDPMILVEPAATNLVVTPVAPSTQGITVTAVAHTLAFTGTGTIVVSGTGSGTLNGTGANDRVSLTFTPTAGTTTLTISGDVNYGQLEIGSVLTSFIDGTRAADVLKIDGVDFSGFWNATEGTLYCESAGRKLGQYIFSADDGGASNRIASLFNPSTHAFIADGGVTQADIDAGPDDVAGVLSRKAISWAANNVAISMDGSSVVSDVSATIPTVDRLNLGSDHNGTNQINGWIGKLIYWPEHSDTLGTDILTKITDPATSADELMKIGEVASYLDLVPNLLNRGTGSDSLQAVAASQPTALPLIGGSGYLHLPGVSGNYASVPDAADLDGFGDFTLQVDDVKLSDWTSGVDALLSKWAGAQRSFSITRSGSNILLELFLGGGFLLKTFAHGLTGDGRYGLRLKRTGTSLVLEIDSGLGFVQEGSPQVASGTMDSTTADVLVGADEIGVGNPTTGAVGRVRIWSDATQTTNVLDIDFSLAAHKATSFTATSGQTVTINQSGDNPADIIGRPVMRLDGVDDYLAGTFASALTAGGTMFLVASVLGAGGESFARLFSTWVTTDLLIDGFLFSYRDASGSNIQSANASALLIHTGGYSGRFLHEVSASDLDSISRINNADEQTSAKDLSAVASTGFAIGGSNTGGSNPAIDFEMLLFYPRKLTAAESSNVRSWIATNYATH